MCREIQLYGSEEGTGRIAALPEAAWADWDHAGRLLMATREGAICIREQRGARWSQLWSQDLRGLAPAPTAAPAWAQRW
jgi:hypothetical protein